MFLARAAKYKGLPDVLAALLRLKDAPWVLTVAGGVHAAEAEVVARLLKNLPQHAVRILGPVCHDGVPALMCECDVVLVPSRYENFCNVALEALAAGKAVVGARCGGIPDLVEHEQNGLLFEPGDVEGLAAALKRLVIDRELVALYGHRGRARAATYDWHAVAEATDTILQRIRCCS